MPEKIEVRCLFGNGVCPKVCRYREMAAQATSDPRFDPAEFRRRVVFADASSDNLNIIKIERILSGCALQQARNQVKPCKP